MAPKKLGKKLFVVIICNKLIILLYKPTLFDKITFDANNFVINKCFSYSNILEIVLLDLEPPLAQFLPQNPIPP